MPILGKAVLWSLIVDASETRSSISVSIKWITAGCAEENIRVMALSAAVTLFFKGRRRRTWWLYLRISDNRTNGRCGNTNMKVFIILSFFIISKNVIEVELEVLFFVQSCSELLSFYFQWICCLVCLLLWLCAQWLSHVWLLATPWTNCGLPGSSVHGFPRQEYWSGLLFPPPGDLPDPGIKPVSLESLALAGRFREALYIMARQVLKTCFSGMRIHTHCRTFQALQKNKRKTVTYCPPNQW